MNKVILMGRLTKDVEMRYSQGATPIAIGRYGLAVRKPFAKQGEAEADFFNILAFGKAAEFAEKFFKKGQLVNIVGRLQNNNWEDQAGVKHFSTEIVIEEQHFAEKANAQQARTAPQEDEESFTPTIVEEDDLPF